MPVDKEGLNISAGIKLCSKARIAYVTPSHQYPLGVTMSASRRFQLLDWAQNSGSWIIEDDYDSEYRYENMPIASLQGLDHNSRVIYIGTFSKTLFPSLRLGYVVIPSDLVERFTAVRQAMDLSPSYLNQAVLNDFMREGHFPRHVRRMRILYGERRTGLVDSIVKEFGTALEVLGAQAGMQLVVTLPKGFRDGTVPRVAHARGFGFGLFPCVSWKSCSPGFNFGVCKCEGNGKPARRPPTEKLAALAWQPGLTKVKRWTRGVS